MSFPVLHASKGGSIEQQVWDRMLLQDQYKAYNSNSINVNIIDQLLNNTTLECMLQVIGEVHKREWTRVNMHYIFY